MTIAELNAMTHDRFLAALGGIFEDSPWVAEGAWAARPFTDIDSMYRAMVDTVDRAGGDSQLALLQAHPDLGARARLSAVSQAEQNRAGLHQLTAAEHKALLARNQEYRDKFGFPFLYAVKGSTSRQILDALERRLQSSPDAEFAEALTQVYRIAWFRLSDALTI